MRSVAAVTASSGATRNTVCPRGEQAQLAVQRAHRLPRRRELVLEIGRVHPARLQLSRCLPQIPHHCGIGLVLPKRSAPWPALASSFWLTLGFSRTPQSAPLRRSADPDALSPNPTHRSPSLCVPAGRRCCMRGVARTVAGTRRGRGRGAYRFLDLLLQRRQSHGMGLASLHTAGMAARAPAAQDCPSTVAGACNIYPRGGGGRCVAPTCWSFSPASLASRACASRSTETRASSRSGRRCLGLAGAATAAPRGREPAVATAECGARTALRPAKPCCCPRPLPGSSNSSSRGCWLAFAFAGEGRACWPFSTARSGMRGSPGESPAPDSCAGSCSSSACCAASSSISVGLRCAQAAGGGQRQLVPLNTTANKERFQRLIFREMCL